MPTGYMGFKPSIADIQDRIPYMVPVKTDQGIVQGTVTGRKLRFPVVHLTPNEQFEVSYAALIHQWETGNPIIA